MNNQRPAENIVLPFMRAKTIPLDEPVKRPLKGAGWLPDKTRHHLVAMVGEIIGTFLFLFFAFAAVQTSAVIDTTGKSSQVPTSLVSVALYNCLAFAFSLMVNVWIFFRISGGLFNPAVSLGLALIGAVGWFRALLTIIAQILGAISAAAVVQCLFPGPLDHVRTRLSHDTSIVRGVFIEMFLTFLLVFTVFMLAAEKHKGTFLAPIGIGLALFVAALAGGPYTGASLNPARSLGPDVVTLQFDGYHWIYWVGPFLGALLAALFYRLIKMLEYETANAGADADSPTAPNPARPYTGPTAVDERSGRNPATRAGPAGSSPDMVSVTSGPTSSNLPKPPYAGPPGNIRTGRDGADDVEETLVPDSYTAAPGLESGQVKTEKK